MITEKDWLDRINLCALDSGYSFLGWADEFIGAKTKAVMFCDKHGEWIFMGLKKLHKRKIVFCPECWLYSNRTSEECLISVFMSNQIFHPKTKFTRSDRKTEDGKRLFWFVECPECGEVNESRTSALRKGSLPCSCGRQKQLFSYIHGFYYEDSLTFLKYGVTNDPKRRLQEHRRNNKTQVISMGIWKFPTKSMCYEAERECRKTLTHALEASTLVFDGKTEIVIPDELERIIQIYENNSGVKVFNSPE